MIKVSSYITKNKPFQKTTLHLEKQQLGTFEPLVVSEIPSKRKVRILDLTSKLTSFQDGYDVQVKLLNQQLKRLEGNNNEKLTVDDDQWYDGGNSGNEGCDCVIFLEHKPVFTLGRASDPSFILSNTNVEVCNTDRGGEVTYHGPGQLVVYPILDLRGYRKDIHWYIRALEEVILKTLQSMNVTLPTRSDDFTGVYVINDQTKSKIASIGIKSRRWVTMHGLAVNVDYESCDNFEYIVPCGLVGFNVTCVNSFLEWKVSVEEFKEYMIPAFEDVFKVTLVE